MKKLILLLISILLLSSCAVHSGLTFNTNNSVTNVVLQGNNYKIIQKVQGTASGFSVFGIGGAFQPIVNNARSEMLRNANLIGRSRAIINETVEVNNKFFVIVGVKTVTVSAYVIEFIDNVQQSAQQINMEQQEIELEQEITNNISATQSQTKSSLPAQKPTPPNAYLNFNEYKNGTPSLVMNFDLRQRVINSQRIANYKLISEDGNELIDDAVWGVQVNGVDYVNSSSFTKYSGYHKIEEKGYYSYFMRETIQSYKLTGYVIFPNGKIIELTPEFLLELCKDNESIVKLIQGSKIKKRDYDKMFEILRQYNLTKEERHKF